MIYTGFSSPQAPAIPVQKTPLNIAYGVCGACYARRITVCLDTVSYRVASIRNRLREFRYCSDSPACVAEAMARKASHS